jgi:23S rRNA pseudouridine2604 synthase
MNPQNKIESVRINKYLADHNYATRKGADELISAGKVFINGRKAVLGDKVFEGDEVEVDQKGPKNKLVYFAYNKPINVTTNPEPETKDILKATKFPTKVFPIGRLDKDSTGLIIMTNDGRVTDRLLSPKYVHEKEYVIRLDNAFNDEFIKAMGNGVRFDGYVSKKCKVWRKNADTFHIILTEGKKRQIRRMCEALHQSVRSLSRIRIMNIQLGKLKQGEFREIKGQELKDFLGTLKLI